MKQTTRILFDWTSRLLGQLIHHFIALDPRMARHVMKAHLAGLLALLHQLLDACNQFLVTRGFPGRKHPME